MTVVVAFETGLAALLLAIAAWTIIARDAVAAVIRRLWAAAGARMGEAFRR